MSQIEQVTVPEGTRGAWTVKRFVVTEQEARWARLRAMNSGGLGLGMVLAAILKKSAVERVTVVEIDADVIGLVAPHYACYACERLEIVNADAFAYVPPKDARYGAVWHDIWDDLCGDNLPEMTKLKRKYGRKTEWQGCWGEHFIRGHC